MDKLTKLENQNRNRQAKHRQRLKDSGGMSTSIDLTPTSVAILFKLQESTGLTRHQLINNAIKELK